MNTLLMSAFVFIVGKADSQQEMAGAIRSLGYKAGLLQDKTVPAKHPEAYDKIIQIDFEKLDEEIAQLEGLDIAGLTCTYENYVIAKAKIGSFLKLPVASVRSAAASTDKYLMRQAFLDADPSITPRFAKVSSEQELLEFASSTTYPLILKPTSLVKSLLVLRCDNQEELMRNFSYAQAEIAALYKKYAVYDRSPQIIVEEFIKGRSCSVAAFVDNQGIPHFCEGIAAITTAQEHGVRDNYLYCRQLPLKADEELTRRLFEVSEIGVKALGMRSTPAHIELMYDGTDVKIIEIGARIGGYRPRMYRYSYGLDLAQQEVRLAVGDPLELDGAFTAYSAVFELFAEREGKFKQIRNLSNTARYTYLSIKPQVGTRVGPAKSGYKAAAVVIVTDKDKQRFDSLCRSVDELVVEVE